MGDVAQSFLTVLLSVEFIIGNLGNGFIALVNGVDWLRRSKISPVDGILTALAVSRIGVLWIVFTNWFVIWLYPVHLRNAEVVKMVHLTWAAANHFSIWLATCLGILYFLKIASFSNSLFLRLKWRVKQVVSGTLLVSVVLLVLNIVLLNIEIDVWVDRYKGNVSHGSSGVSMAKLSAVFVFSNSFYMLVPFAVSLATFLLLILSLCRHLRTLQRGAPGCGDASTAAHVKALRAVVAFLLLYAVFFLSVLVQIWSSEFLDRSLIFSFSLIAGTTYPSFHSCVLILGDSKLRRASLSVMWWLRGRPQMRGPQVQRLGCHLR